MEPLYFRIYGDYQGPGPIFYPREECPWLADVERHWQTIRAEFEEHYYRRRQALSDSYVPDDVEVRGWRSVNFVTYLHWYRANCERFPKTVEILRTIPCSRFVTGVTWVDGELWHGTWEADESDLRRLDPRTGEVLATLEMPPGSAVSGLESDGRERFFCGGGRSGKVRVVRRPR